MRPSGWGSFMQWRDDTTLPSPSLRLRPIGKSNKCFRRPLGDYLGPLTMSAAAVVREEAVLGGGDDMPPSPIVNHLVRTVTDGSRGASRDPVQHSEDTGGHMTTLSLEQAARLTGRGKTILGAQSLVGYSREVRKAAVLTLMAPSRRESTRSLLLSKQRPNCAPVLPWPRSGGPNWNPCVRTCDVTAMLGASRLRRACYRHLRHGCHGGRGGVQPDEEALSKAPMRDASRTWIASFPRIGNRGRHSDKSHRPESSR